MPPSGPREVIAAVVAVAGFASWFTSGPLGNRPAPPPLIPAILVVAPDIAARPQIFIVDPGGSGRRQLTRSDGLKAYPSWSRDRTARCCLPASPSGMNADGSGQRQGLVTRRIPDPLRDQPRRPDRNLGDGSRWRRSASAASVRLRGRPASLVTRYGLA